MHQSANLTFERIAREFAQWRAVAGRRAIAGAGMVVGTGV